MTAYIVNRTSLRRYGQRLSRLPIDRSMISSDPEKEMPGCIGDLGPDDHVILPSCSRAYCASHLGVSCHVSVWLREPPAIQGRFYRWMPMIAKRYHRILTYDQKILDTISNAHFLAHGGCWVDHPEAAGSSEKTDSVSIVASPKRDTTGHQLRHSIIEWAEKQGHDLTSFGKGYQALPNKVDGHEKFRFSVVIENSRSSNYFTEKLIDSLVCMSLPIYWGTPQIEQFFDPDGMIICQTQEQLQKALQSVSSDLYQSKLSALQENRRRALGFANPHKLLFDALFDQSSNAELLDRNNRFDQSHASGSSLPSQPVGKSKAGQGKSVHLIGTTPELSMELSQ